MQKLASMYPIYNLLHKWKWSREHKLWLIMIDSSWWQTEIMTQQLENYCLVIFLFFSRFATGSCRAVVFRFRGHGFIFNFTAFFNCFLFISFDFLLLFLFILLYLRPWTDILLLEVSQMSTMEKWKPPSRDPRTASLKTLENIRRHYLYIYTYIAERMIQ